MTKADIIVKIADRVGCSGKDAAGYLESVFSIMKSTLESGETLKITGFGAFEVKQKKDRKGRNPQTGEPMTITARKILSFRSSGLLRKAVNLGLK